MVFLWPEQNLPTKQKQQRLWRSDRIEEEHCHTPQACSGNICSLKEFWFIFASLSKNWTFDTAENSKTANLSRRNQHVENVFAGDPDNAQKSLTNYDIAPVLIRFQEIPIITWIKSKNWTPKLLQAFNWYWIDSALRDKKNVWS